MSSGELFLLVRSKFNYDNTPYPPLDWLLFSHFLSCAASLDLTNLNFWRLRLAPAVSIFITPRWYDIKTQTAREIWLGGREEKLLLIVVQSCVLAAGILFIFCSRQSHCQKKIVKLCEYPKLVFYIRQLIILTHK
jgi:hypothetical protein